MSQNHVERVIGRLVTDECARHQFCRNPQDTLQRLKEYGVELTESEMRSLAALDTRELERFAECIDPRLQKSDLEGGVS